MKKRSELTLSDVLLYEAMKDERGDVDGKQFEKASKKLNELHKKKDKFVPFEQFIEEQNIIRGQE